LELWLAGWLLVQVSEFFPFFHFSEQAGGGALISFQQKNSELHCMHLKAFWSVLRGVFFKKILHGISAQMIQKSPQDWRYILNH
jgi:hypothetical protein